MKDAFERASIAVFEGDHVELEELLRTPGLATHRTEVGHPTLLQMVACEAQHLPDAPDATRLLVDAGAETTGPLIAAAGCDSRNVVEVLLDMGVTVDADHDGWTPLDEALYWDNEEMAHYLVDHGANLGRLRRVAGLGDVAATQAFFDGSRLVADAGPLGSPFPATLTDEQSVDPQHIIDHAFVMAVNSGRKAAAAVLLDRGAQVNARPPGYHWKGAALHAAIWRGDVELVQWLLDNGADPTRRDGMVNADALDWARHHEHAALVALFEKRTPDEPGDPRT